MFWIITTTTFALTLTLIVAESNSGIQSTPRPRIRIGDEPDVDPTKIRYDRYEQPDKSDCTLRAYDAEAELNVIKEWYDMVKTPVDEETAMRQLLLEACDDEGKDLKVMCLAFLEARVAEKTVPGLTRAECVSVTMYTAEMGGFYRVYNNDSAHGVWAPYRVYTSLLLSAVKKLSNLYPVPIQERLYRGMSVKCRPPNAKRIFWKAFTSTSLDEEIAAYFGQSTTLLFRDSPTIYGAQIKNLSLVDVEDEVLISPFEAFDFERGEEQVFHFSASRQQQLLMASGVEHPPRLSVAGVIGLLQLVLALRLQY